MKILNVFDCAGIGALYSSAIKDCSVIQLRALDPWHIGDFYNNTIFCNSINEVVETAVERMMDYDHVLIHDMPDTLHAFKAHPDVSIMYHGSRLRQYPERCIDSGVKRIFVSTEDLLQYKSGSILLPRPIDVNHFRPMETGKIHEVPFKITKTYFIPYLEKMRGGIEYHDRDKNPIEYKDVPMVLNQHRFYDDLRLDYSKPPNIIKSLSCTALQALACGKSVVTWNRDLITEFPEQHNLNNSATFLNCILNES